MGGKGLGCGMAVGMFNKLGKELTFPGVWA